MGTLTGDLHRGQNHSFVENLYLIYVPRGFLGEEKMLLLFFSLFFFSKEHFSIIFVQYLGVTVGTEPAT
jgi:hypothetical protein